MRNVIRNDIAALSLRFSTPLARANQSQRQSQDGKTRSSRCACRLGADGGLPLGRHFSHLTHGVPGAFPAWAPPLGGLRGRSPLVPHGVRDWRWTRHLNHPRIAKRFESDCPRSRARLQRGCPGGERWDAGLCPPLENRTLGRSIRAGARIFWRLPPASDCIAGATPSEATAARRMAKPSVALSHPLIFYRRARSALEKIRVAPIRALVEIV